MTNDIIRFGARWADLARGVVGGPGGEVSLTPNEASLLRYLASRRGRTVSKEELLRAVFGYAKGVRSRTVISTVQRLRSKIEPEGQEPVHLLTVRGRGYRFEAGEELGVFGRAAELDAVLGLLDADHVVQIVAPGGFGKTTLARAVARRLDGRFFELRGATDLEGLVERLGRALNLGPTDLSRIGISLREAGQICVLDEVEGALSHVPALIQALQREAPQLRLLLTSRAPVVGVPAFELGALTIPDAVELLRDRSTAASIDHETWVGVAERVGGVPLALEIAAARLAWGGTLPEQPLPALEQVFHWSWDHLPASAQFVLRAAAVFEQGFTLSEIEQVSGATPTELETLYRHGLLSRTHAEMSLLTPIRELAAAEGVPEAVRRAHCRVQRDLAIQMRWDAEAGDGKALERLAARWSDLGAAFAWSIQEEPVLAVEIAVGVVPGMRLWDATASALERLDQAVAASESCSDDLKTAALTARGHLRFTRHQAARALEDLRPAVEGSDPRTPEGAYARLRLGAARLRQSEFSEAELLFGAATEVPAPLQWVLAFEQSLLDLRRDERERAVQTLRAESVAAATRGAERAELVFSGTLASALRHLGSFREAEGYLRRAIDLATGLRDLGNLAVLENTLGNVLSEQGAFEEAILAYRRSAAGHARLGNQRGMAYATYSLSSAELDRGELEAARAHATQALALGRACQDPRVESAVLRMLAGLAYLRGRLDVALELLSDVPDPHWHEWVQRGLILADRGDVAGARSEAARAEGCQHDDYRLPAWTALLGLAITLAELQDARRGDAALHRSFRVGLSEVRAMRGAKRGFLRETLDKLEAAYQRVF